MESALPNLPHVYLAVSMLLGEFASRVDRGANVGDLLAEDAVLETPRGAVKGREAITALFRSQFEARQAQGRRSRHYSSNLVVEQLPDGGIEARSLLTAVALEAGEGMKGTLLLGDQLDRIVRGADGDLRFKRRTLSPHLRFELTPAAEQRA